MDEEIQRLHNLIANMQENNGKVYKLVERLLGIVEDHQKRMGRLEQLLTPKQKKVSRNPGDRET